MSEEGKQAALAIAEQMRIKDERIAQLEEAVRDCLAFVDDAHIIEGNFDWLYDARRVVAKAGPR